MNRRRSPMVAALGNAKGYFVAALLLAGCGGGKGESRGPSDTPGEALGTLWSMTASVPFLRGIDLKSGEVTVNLQVAQGSTDIFAYGVADGQVWLGRDDGVALAVEDGEIQTTQTFGDANIEAIAVGGGSAYVATGSPAEPRLVRLSSRDFEIAADERVIEQTYRFEALARDDKNVYVLVGNGFGVLKLHPETLAIEGNVPLHNAGTAGPFDASGYMIELGPSLWVIGYESGRLIRIDKQTMMAETVGDVADLTQAQGNLELVANSKQFFFEVQGLRKVVGFDGRTGTRLRTYAIEGGVSYIAASDAALYVRPEDDPASILELDIDSGATKRTLADNQGSWLLLE